jgi:uncharacterized HAD superfamily protein
VEETADLTKRLRIAVDVDGVLANQIDGIAKRLNPGLETPIEYEQITHWRYEFEGTDIATEILNAMLMDASYVAEMPVHEGARAMLAEFDADDEVLILTARPAQVLELTEAWLRENDLRFDAIISTKEALKSGHGADVLIDDYLGNAVEYLTNSHGLCIVVDQPWNRERDELAPWVESGRVVPVHGLSEIPAVIEKARSDLVWC